jgi:hypothetical protein
MHLHVGVAMPTMDQNGGEEAEKTTFDVMLSNRIR